MVLLRYNELIDFFQDLNGHNIAGDEINGIFLHKTSMQVISIEIMRSPERIEDLHLPYRWIKHSFWAVTKYQLLDQRNK